MHQHPALSTLQKIPHSSHVVGLRKVEGTSVRLVRLLCCTYISDPDAGKRTIHLLTGGQGG